MPFPVFCRGYPRYFPELLVKMAQVVKTTAETNIRNAHPEYDARLMNQMTALNIIEEALASGSMTLPEMETSYLPILRDELSTIPDHESDFVEMMLPVLDQGKFIMAEYGL